MSDDELFYGSDEDDKVNDSNDELEDKEEEIESADEAKSIEGEGENEEEEEEEEEMEEDEDENEDDEEYGYEDASTRKRKRTATMSRCKSNETLVSARSAKSAKSSKSGKSSKSATSSNNGKAGKTVPKNTKRSKKPVLSSKLEKIYLSAKQEERLYRPPANTREDLESLTLPPSKKPTNVSHRRFKTTVSDQLCEPIGFEGLQDFAARLQACKTKTFEIERSFLLNKTRFVPFGPKEFYQQTASFYTKPTTIACWWCTESFLSLPVPMPVKYHEDFADPERSYWQVTGVFCSPSCMLSKSRSSMRNFENLARLFLKRAYSLKTAEVECAPDPLSLAKFGGKYSIEQFRATGGAGIKTVPHNMPFLPVSAGLCEIESFVTVIKEQGGVELAKKRFTGKAVFGANIVPITSSTVCVQKSHFAQAPTIEQQIQQSDSKLRLQQQQGAKAKTTNILSFMSLTKHENSGLKK